jgi:hypothetical protein
MAEYHGDATGEEIKKQVTAHLRGQLAGITTERWMGRLVPIEVDQRDVRNEIPIKNIKPKQKRVKRRRGRYVKTCPA